jgi:hypothetical protein
VIEKNHKYVTKKIYVKGKKKKEEEENPVMRHIFEFKIT